MKTKTMYMHTWKGRPARWDPKAKHIFAVIGGGARITLCSSIATIRRQQQADWTRGIVEGAVVKHGWKQTDYGVVRVEVPANVR